MKGLGSVCKTFVVSTGPSLVFGGFGDFQVKNTFIEGVLHDYTSTSNRCSDSKFFYYFKQISKRQKHQDNVQWEATHNTANHKAFQSPHRLQTLDVHQKTSRQACGALQRTLQTF